MGSAQRWFPVEPRKPPSQYISLNGYYAGEVVSACQKSIRRGWDEAYIWFLELFWSIKAHRTRVWNRILIMAVEDVGLANPDCLKYVYYEYVNSKDDPLALCLACEHLLTSKKSRINDIALIYYANHIEDGEASYELLLDALRDKDPMSAIAYAQRLHTSGNTQDIWDACCEMSGSTYIDMVLEIQSNKYFRNKGAVRLFWSHLIHCIIYDVLPEDNMVDVEQDLSRLQGIVDEHQNNSDLGIPDVAVDKHTIRGRRLGRGMRHFLEEGSRLENADEIWEERASIYM